MSPAHGGDPNLTLMSNSTLDAAVSLVTMLICMQSTSVRIDVATHEELKRLASELDTTVGRAVSLAVRALRQDRIGRDLSAPLTDEEVTWLDADLG